MTIRVVLPALVCVLLAAGSADAAPRALAPMTFGTMAAALAGEHVLVAEQRARGARLEVRALPIDGGPARIVFSITAPPGEMVAPYQLAASPQRAAMVVAFWRSGGNTELQHFATGADGAWRPLGPRREHGDHNGVGFVRVDGDRVFADDGIDPPKADGQRIGIAVHDPDRRVLSLPSDARIAGDMAAFAATGADGRSTLTVVNWRTGAQLWSTKLDRSLADVRVRDDGSAVVSVIDEIPGQAAAGSNVALLEIAPDGTRKELARDVTLEAVAGRRVVVGRANGLAVLEPTGLLRRIGVPTRRSRIVLAADERHVLWEANGCLLITGITDAPASEPGPGPCRRSEFEVVTKRLRIARTVTVRLRCVAAPAGGCRTTVRLLESLPSGRFRKASPPTRVTIPVGKKGSVTLTLSPKHRARLKRTDPSAVAIELRHPDGTFERHPVIRWPDGRRMRSSPRPRRPLRDFRRATSSGDCAMNLRESLPRVVRAATSAHNAPPRARRLCRQGPAIVRTGLAGGHDGGMPSRIREATSSDWAAIWPIVRDVVRAADTFTYDSRMSEDTARAMWLVGAPGRTTVAVDGSVVLGTANMYANRAGPGAHVASASFMVASSARGRGVGRALVEDALSWARAAGFRGMQFNAVAESNAAAVALYRSLGFSVVGTVPEAFEHPRHGFVGLHVMYRPL